MLGGGQFQETRVGVPRSHRNNHNGGHSAEAGGPWPKGIGAASLPADAADAEVGVSTWITGVSREPGRPGDGIHCDDSARLTRSGPPRSRSDGDGCWQGRGCSGGRSEAELGTEVIDGLEAATHAQEAVMHTN